jgi:hypothetical protein
MSELDKLKNEALSEKILIGELMQLVVDELKAAPMAWQKLTEAKQSEVIFRIQQRVEDMVREAVGVLAAGDRMQVKGAIESITYKGGAKVVIKVARSEEGCADLGMCQGKTAIVAIVDMARYGGAERVKPDPQQQVLDVSTH